MLKFLKNLNKQTYYLYTITNQITKQKFLWKTTDLNKAIQNHQQDFQVQQYYLNDLMTYHMYYYGFENFVFDIFKEYENIGAHELDLKLTKYLMSEEFVYNNNSPVFYTDFSILRKKSDFYYYEALEYTKLWKETKESNDYLLAKQYADLYLAKAKELKLLQDKQTLNLNLVQEINDTLKINNLKEFITLSQK